MFKSNSVINSFKIYVLTHILICNKMKNLNNVVKFKLDFTKVGAPLCARLAQAIFADVCKIVYGIFA